MMTLMMTTMMTGMPDNKITLYFFLPVAEHLSPIISCILDCQVGGVGVTICVFQRDKNFPTNYWQLSDNTVHRQHSHLLHSISFILPNLAHPIFHPASLVNNPDSKTYLKDSILQCWRINLSLLVFKYPLGIPWFRQVWEVLPFLKLGVIRKAYWAEWTLVTFRCSKYMVAFLISWRIIEWSCNRLNNQQSAALSKKYYLKYSSCSIVALYY